MLYKFDEERYNRLFGPKDNLESTGPGKSRRCKVCEGWHRLDKPWPHNCRDERPPKSDLAAPMLAPGFDPFMTGKQDNATYIGSRGDKREFMKENELVEYDTGVDTKADWVEDRKYDRELVEDIQRFSEIDTDYIPPELKAQDMHDDEALDGAGEIDTDNIEVVE